MSNISELIEKYQNKENKSIDSRIKLDFLLVEILKEKGDLTRKELSELTKIPRTTIYDSIKKLIFERKLEKYAISDRKRGRPKVYYRLISQKL